ncbi:MAG: putative lipid II flippase FtsW [Clostridia bacterium]|nr:putative lipid II flippase FtsW [Clostridia bacterium]
MKKLSPKLQLNWRNIDHIFLLTVIALTAYGLVMVFSASAPSAFYIHGDSMFFFKNQAIWAVLGFVVMIVVSMIDYKFIKRFIMPIYIVAMILLLAVLFIGQRINGAKRWLDFGFSTIQPSEFAKIAIVMACAWVLSKVKTIDVKESLPHLIICGMLVGFAAIMLLLQPHFSAILIILLALGIMMIAAGIPMRLFSVIAGIVALVGVIFAIAEPYRLQRLISFTDPFQDKSGDGWQVVQSLYAIGSGGFSGLGLGRSRQKFLYIPEPQNDFIFSIICEELGFLGALAVLVLFALLLYRAVKIALKAPDRYSMLLVFGLISLTIVQVLLNIGVATSSVPPTGIPLPFFSAGGTSFVFQMISMGMILNISAQPKKSSKTEIRESDSFE